MINKETKQVILVRKDLNMRKGKMTAQGSHGSESFITRQLQNKLEILATTIRPAIARDGEDITIHLTDEEVAWIRNDFTKVVVAAKDEEELLAVHNHALSLGLTSHLVTDAGKTEFHGKPTETVVAIGPHYLDKFEGVTDHLPLL